MIVLGIDTSGYANAVGIADGGRTIAEATCPARTDSLERIVGDIDAVLKKAGLGLGDIGGIGVGLGPGSWTGIRVGVTVAKMLAFTTARPIAGIPTLEALAFACRGEGERICAVVPVGVGDAVYAGLYRISSGEVVRDGGYFIGEARGLVDLLERADVVTGEGIISVVRRVAPVLEGRVKMVEALPSGAAVAGLAGLRLGRGGGDDVLALAPLYLKEATVKAFTRYHPSR